MGVTMKNKGLAELLVEFKDRYIEMGDGDWNRLKPVREQEPLEFLEEIYTAGAKDMADALELEDEKIPGGWTATESIKLIIRNQLRHEQRKIADQFLKDL